MVEIGKYSKLRVVREAEFGVFLDGDWLGEVYMPHKQADKKYTIDDVVQVFIYLDSRDSYAATMKKPRALVGEFVLLKVEQVNEFGAFLDWGLSKDLLVPFREQKVKMVEGRSYVVRIYLDEMTNRIAASSKLDRFLNLVPVDFKEGDLVDLIVCNETEMGYNAIINSGHWGLIYSNEVFQPLSRGQELPGYVKKIRDDGKIDLALHKPGYDKVDEFAGIILEKLDQYDGFLAVNDKSDPELIYDMFGISKKSFKKAVGALYRKKMITLEGNGMKKVEIPLGEK